MNQVGEKKKRKQTERERAFVILNNYLGTGEPEGDKSNINILKKNREDQKSNRPLGLKPIPAL